MRAALATIVWPAASLAPGPNQITARIKSAGDRSLANNHKIGQARFRALRRQQFAKEQPKLHPLQSLLGGETAQFQRREQMVNALQHALAQLLVSKKG